MASKRAKYLSTLNCSGQNLNVKVIHCIPCPKSKQPSDEVDKSIENIYVRPQNNDLQVVDIQDHGLENEKRKYQMIGEWLEIQPSNSVHCFVEYVCATYGISSMCYQPGQTQNGFHVDTVLDEKVMRCGFYSAQAYTAIL